MAGPASGGHSFPRSARITDSEEIRGLFRRGKRRKTRHLDVFVSASPAARSRFGVVVPKPRRKTYPKEHRLPGPAVARNRLKRQLREIGRTAILPELAGRGCRVDVLVRARPEAYVAGFAALHDELAALREWMCSNDS